MIERFKYLRGIGERRIYRIDTTAVLSDIEIDEIVTRLRNSFRRSAMIPDHLLNHIDPIPDNDTTDRATYTHQRLMGIKMLR